MRFVPPIQAPCVAGWTLMYVGDFTGNRIAKDSKRGVFIVAVSVVVSAAFVADGSVLSDV